MKPIIKSLYPLTLFLSIILFTCQNKPMNVEMRKENIHYKTIGSIELNMDVFYPKNYETRDDWPAVILFHGGHWIGGKPSMMHHIALKFAAKGFVAFTPVYRLQNDHEASPFEALKDAKSAIRYLRKHAQKLRINPTQIIAGGGSAGGQLVAAAACTTKYNEDGESLSTSCIPDGIILYAAVIDNGPTGYGHNRIGEQYHDFSPFHLVKENLPPTLILHGEDDELLSCDRMREYCTKLSGKNNVCSLKCYKGVGHKLNTSIYNGSVPMALSFFQETKILNLANPIK